MPFNLTGKVAIITGAASGIGLASVQAALEANCSVFAVDVSPLPPTLPPKYPNLRFHHCNLADVSAPDSVIQACHEAFGPRIDILQNVAGIMDGFQSADTVTDEAWDRIMAVNLTAPVRLMRAVLQVMKMQRSGSIVNVASLAGTSGNYAGIAYTVSKHGLVGATKNVAYRFRGEGIRCNAIAPGAVNTNIQTSYDTSKTDLDALEYLKPIYALNGEGTILQPDAVAELLIFLSSDASKDINGTVIPIGSVLT